MSSFEGLIQASATAVETLVDVMENSRRDDARVAAAREVLDRVGIKADSDIHLHVHGESDGGESVATSLRKRLAEMNGAMKEADELKARLGIGQSEIIDAEVIDE